jgi:hypothetical protein
VGHGSQRAALERYVAEAQVAGVEFVGSTKLIGDGA